MIQVFESSGRGAHFYPEYPPFLKLEPSSKCTRHCEFCSIVDNVHGHFMDYDLFTRILDESKNYDVKKVSFSIHGEPTMHPRIVDMVHDTRRTFPDARIFTITNGDVFRKQEGLIVALYLAGMDDIQLDAYDEISSAYVDQLLRDNVYIRDNVSEIGRAHV
jgi:wyosine [tRNA(Phe)-imidazoG37] synthetase (radical SAM superfamily)